MKKLLPLIACVPFLSGAEVVPESALDPAPITAVGLYKNGLALVTRQVTPDAATGLAWVDGAARPSYGFFWPATTDPVSMRTLACDVQRAVQDVAPDGDWAKALAGREVALSFRAAPALDAILAAAGKAGGSYVKAYSAGEKDVVYTQEGHVLKPAEPQKKPDSEARYSYSYVPSARSQIDQTLTLRLVSGSTVTVPLHLLVAASVKEGAQGTLERGRSLWRFAGAKKPFALTYLCEGASWTPSYRLTLAGEKGRLEMAADLCNEMADWRDAEVSLISGFPSLVYAPVHALVGCGMDFATYRREVEAAESTDPWVRRTARDGVMRQSVMLNAVDGGAGAGDGVDYAAAAPGQGADIHYRSIGKVTLKKGEVLTFPLGAAETAVKRIVDWDLVDGRGEDGRPLRNDKPNTAILWDAVKLKNPFAFPLTTAPIVVEEEGRILGQAKSLWTNPGEETRVRVTKALSVKGDYEERGEGKSGALFSKVSSGGEKVHVNGSDYRKEVVTGTFKVRNFRAEPAELNIRKAFSGELLEVSEKTSEEKILPATDGRVNVTRELRWEFTLKPGEAREIKLSYWLWVRL